MAPEQKWMTHKKQRRQLANGCPERSNFKLPQKEKTVNGSGHIREDDKNSTEIGFYIVYYELACVRLVEARLYRGNRGIMAVLAYLAYCFSKNVGLICTGNTSLLNMHGVQCT